MYKNLAIVVFVVFYSLSVNAGDYCTEKITTLILNSSDIIFKSSKSCPNWCRVNSDWSEEQKNRAYSMLLAARTVDREITMYWEELSSNCEKAVEVHSSPSIIYY